MSADTSYDVSPVFLLDVASKSPVEAELWSSITNKNIDDWQQKWLPATNKVVDALTAQGVDRRLWPQSTHWNWEKKKSSIEALLGNQTFSIVCQGITQGMMITDLTRRAKLEKQKGNHLIYVDYVEVAPWNRPSIVGNPQRYAGTGKLLILAAIELSKQEEFKGRIGLHSLPQANDFYANKCGMTDLGPDPDPTYRGLRYFEMTPEQATVFIEKGGKS